jgi:hypothetical protein
MDFSISGAFTVSMLEGSLPLRRPILHRQNRRLSEAWWSPGTDFMKINFSRNGFGHFFLSKADKISSKPQIFDTNGHYSRF